MLEQVKSQWAQQQKLIAQSQMQKAMIQKLMSEKNALVSEPIEKEMTAALEKANKESKPHEASKPKPKHKKHKKAKKAVKKDVKKETGVAQGEKANSTEAKLLSAVKNIYQPLPGKMSVAQTD